MTAFVEWDDREVVKKLQKLWAVTGDLSPALKEINEVLVESTKKRFDTGIAPDGQKWADNSDVTIARKGRNKPMVYEGELARQISGELIGKTASEISSPMVQAAMLQFGGDKSEFPHLWGDIKARPFFGISSDDEAEILRILEQHLERSTY